MEELPSAPQLPTAAATANNSLLPNDAESQKAKKWSIKITLIIIALIVMQIPIYMISGLNEERMRQQNSATEAIAGSWAGEQAIQSLTLDHNIPDKFDIQTTLIPEIRYRGIYQSVIYTSESLISAEFPVSGKKILLNISAPRGFMDMIPTINGKPVTYTIGKETDFSAIAIAVPENVTAPVKFQCTLKLRGSGNFSSFACGMRNNITFSGKWDSPNFGESDLLPDSRQITEEGFSADWQINNLSADLSFDRIAKVEFHIPTSAYQQVERTITYATFFLVVFFFTLICGELLAKVPLHPAQYIIAAGAPVLFYLMLLSVGEKTGFASGYLISSIVIVLMVSGYARLFFNRTLPAVILGTVFAASYAVNYLILQMEEFALLSGTIILAVFLAVSMLLTGKLNRAQSAE